MSDKRVEIRGRSRILWTIGARAGIAAWAMVGSAFFCAPADAQITPAPASDTVIDAQAQTRLSEVATAYRGLHSYFGTMERQVVGTADAQLRATVLWKDPNRALVMTSGSTGDAMAVCDGVKIHATRAGSPYVFSFYAPLDKSAIVSTLRAGHIFTLGNTDLLPQGGDVVAALGRDLRSLSIGPDEVVESVAVHTVIARFEGPQSTAIVTYAIGDKDHLLHRVSLTQNSGGQSSTVIETHRIISPNGPISDSAFEFAPPPNLPGEPSVAEAPTSQARSSHEVGKLPLAFSSVDTAGANVSLDQYKGRVVLLDFWAAWSEPSRKEEHNRVSVYNAYKDQGFDIVGVSIDSDVNAMLAFTRQNNMSWRQISQEKQWDGEIAKLFDLHSLPWSLLIGRDGRIVGVDPQGPDLAVAVKAAVAGK